MQRQQQQSGVVAAAKPQQSRVMCSEPGLRSIWHMPHGYLVQLLPGTSKPLGSGSYATVFLMGCNWLHMPATPFGHAPQQQSQQQQQLVSAGQPQDPPAAAAGAEGAEDPQQLQQQALPGLVTQRHIVIKDVDCSHEAQDPLFQLSTSGLYRVLFLELPCVVQVLCAWVRMRGDTVMGFSYGMPWLGPDCRSLAQLFACPETSGQADEGQERGAASCVPSNITANPGAVVQQVRWRRQGLSWGVHALLLAKQLHAALQLEAVGAVSSDWKPANLLIVDYKPLQKLDTFLLAHHSAAQASAAQAPGAGGSGASGSTAVAAGVWQREGDTWVPGPAAAAAGPKQEPWREAAQMYAATHMEVQVRGGRVAARGGGLGAGQTYLVGSADTTALQADPSGHRATDDVCVCLLGVADNHQCWLFAWMVTVPTRTSSCCGCLGARAAHAQHICCSGSHPAAASLQVELCDKDSVVIDAERAASDSEAAASSTKTPATLPTIASSSNGAFPASSTEPKLVHCGVRNPGSPDYMAPEVWYASNRISREEANKRAATLPAELASIGLSSLRGMLLCTDWDFQVSHTRALAGLWVNCVEAAAHPGVPQVCRSCPQPAGPTRRLTHVSLCLLDGRA